MYENVQEFLKSRNLHEDDINGNKKLYNKLLLNDPKLVVLFELKMLQDDKFKNYVMSDTEIANDINLFIELELLYDKLVNVMNLYIYVFTLKNIRQLKY